MKHVIAASRPGYEDLPRRLSNLTQHEFVLLTGKDALTVERLRELQPRYVFLPHWSYLIPREIHENFECIIFHMTDVPFGRGGSPLQNLVSRGIYETKVTALKCQAELDAGPVYLKEPLSLFGSAEEIYLRAAKVIEQMIAKIVLDSPAPQPQVGPVTAFVRRKPAESNLEGLESLEQVFDHIRMLDAEGYPHAFIQVGGFKFEFTRASFKPGEVIADVRIFRND